MTPLHLAAWRNHIEVAEALLRSGADVNFKNSSYVSVCYSL